VEDKKKLKLNDIIRKQMHKTDIRVRECFNRFKIGNIMRGFELQKAGYFKSF
jgi:hypothetical protein